MTMSSQPLTFWIGASGSATGFGIASSIRQHWGAEARIVALDTNEPQLNAASTLADEYLQVPAAESPGYVAAMKRLIAAAGGPTVYMPVYDSEILEAARLAERGGLPQTFRILTVGGAAAVAACNDKLSTYGRLSAAGIPAASTMLLSSAGFTGPALVKPRWGVASSGRRAESAHELDVLRRELDGEAFVVQEWCGAPEVTVDVFRGRDPGPNSGLERVLCRERLQVKAGVVTKTRIFEDPQLSMIARQIATAIGLAGSFCFQVMRATCGEGWRITDVNPRPGAGTRMCAALGCDFAAASVADFLGQSASRLLPSIRLPQFVVRQYAEYVTTRPAVV